MATITRSYTMTDGDTLVPASLNGDLYSITAGKGIWSESNGGLDANNLDATFKIQEHMVIPGEAVRAEGISNAPTLEIVSTAFGTDKSSNFVPIPGLSKRVYFPYDVRFILWEWQFYFSVWRHYTGTYEEQTTAPIIATKAFIDGFPLAHTLAGCPETIIGMGPGQAGTKKEHLMSDSRSGSHLAVDVSKGWHELSIRLYMASQTMQQDMQVITSPDPIDANCLTAHRFSAGYRHVRCLSLL